MAYKNYTRQMLADFTGRPLASFPENYVTKSAIPQALLLFKIGTCLNAPDDLQGFELELVDNAIISMADAIHLVAPYQAAMANPFSSESIGSYSYSKAAQAVAHGLPTGIGWFDIAVEKLSVCDDLDGLPMSGGIEIFEHDAYAIGAGSQAGNVRLLTPADVQLDYFFRHDPAPGFGR